jgi:predicted NAD/FAD-dependent oxidoreductase
MTTTDGSSCLFVSVQLGYPLITRPLLKAGGRELLVMNRNDGTSCLAAVRQNLTRLEDYHADNLKSDHKEVMRLIQQACLDWGVELE